MRFLSCFVLPLWSLYIRLPIPHPRQQHIVAPTMASTRHVLLNGLHLSKKEWNVVDFSRPEGPDDDEVTHIPVVSILRFDDVRETARTEGNRGLRDAVAEHTQRGLFALQERKHRETRLRPQGEHPQRGLFALQEREHRETRLRPQGEHHHTVFEGSRYAEVMSYPEFCRLEEKMARIVFAYLGDTRRHWMLQLDPLFLYSDSVRRYGTRESVSRTLWVTPSVEVGVPDAVLWMPPPPPYRTL